MSAESVIRLAALAVWGVGATLDALQRVPDSRVKAFRTVTSVAALVFALLTLHELRANLEGASATDTLRYTLLPLAFAGLGVFLLTRLIPLGLQWIERRQARNDGPS